MSVYHDSLEAMGTRLDVVLPEIETAHGRAVFQSIADEVRRLDEKLS